MATTKKAVPMCIGYHDYLMPASAGMKVVELMTSAVQCEGTGYSPRVYAIGEQPEVQLTMVKASQIRQRPRAADDVNALENNPTPVLRLR